ncbi:MAG: hypothetical protein M0T81_00255 [Thermoplasmatales archaeon]|jgi:hypothetical protein|nr:hypothetical protein [Thermoplasmatales archaeon]
MTTRKFLISVSEEEGYWLDSHPEVNKSGLFQRVIHFMMESPASILTDDSVSEILSTTSVERSTR